jgi:hypothetical protein
MTPAEAEIGENQNDLAEGRVKAFDSGRLARRGKKLLRDRSRSG